MGILLHAWIVAAACCDPMTTFIAERLAVAEAELSTSISQPPRFSRSRSVVYVSDLDAGGSASSDQLLSQALPLLQRVRQVSSERPVGLSLISKHGISPFPLARLRHLTELRILRLHDFCLSDEDMAVIGQCTALSELELLNVDASDDALKRLAQLKNLRQLTVSNDRDSLLTGAFLSAFENGCELSVLRLHGVALSRSSSIRIGKLRALKSLDLSDCNFDGSLLSAFESRHSLEELGLDRCDVTDADLKALADFRALRTIGASGCNISRDGIQAILGLPSIEYVEFYSTTASEQLGVNAANRDTDKHFFKDAFQRD